MHNYIYTPRALKQFGDAIEWYNEKSNLAAENFIFIVTQKIKLICINPKRYANLYKHFRETALSKYPYSIIYFVEETTNTVVIAKILHHKRNPKSKYR